MVFCGIVLEIVDKLSKIVLFPSIKIHMISLSIS